MPTVDHASLAEQARTLAADMRAAPNFERIASYNVCHAIDLLEVLAAALTPAPTSEPRPFEVGDRVRFARKIGPESTHANAPPLGWEGVIVDSRIPFRVEGRPWENYRYRPLWWFVPEALDLLPTEDGQ